MCPGRAFKTSGRVAKSSAPTFRVPWDPSGTSSRGCISLPTVEHFRCLDTCCIESCVQLPCIDPVSCYTPRLKNFPPRRSHSPVALPTLDPARLRSSVGICPSHYSGDDWDLLKDDDSQSVFFLVESELIPLCLRIMGNVNSTERARTGAAWIVEKSLLNDFGSFFFLDLAYCF